MAASPYRTRIIQEGIETLTDAELLDLLLNPGGLSEEGLAACREVLAWGGSLQGLACRSWTEIGRQAGMGERKALQIATLFELARRSARTDARTIDFRDARQVASYLQPLLRDALQEQLLLLLLDRAGQLLAERVVFVGGVTQTVVDPKVIFHTLLTERASAFIICHNHPSGTVIPSEHDIAITRRLQEGARLLDFQLVDHLIVSYKGYYSFADNHLL